MDLQRNEFGGVNLNFTEKRGKGLTCWCGGEVKALEHNSHELLTDIQCPNHEKRSGYHLVGRVFDPQKEIYSAYGGSK